MMNRTQKTSRRPPMNYLDRKRGWGLGAVSSRSFDLLNSMIYDLKLSVDLRWLFDLVLHVSLEDLVFSKFLTSSDKHHPRLQNISSSNLKIRVQSRGPFQNNLILFCEQLWKESLYYRTISNAIQIGWFENSNIRLFL